MSLHVNAVEALWVSIVLTALGVTIWALLDSYNDAMAVKVLNGHVRGIVARGNLRREALRLLTQLLLLGIAIPSLFRPGDTDVTHGLLIVMGIPILLLANSLLDQNDRQRIARRLVADLESGRKADIEKLETLAADANALAADANVIAADTNAIAAETKERVIDIQERT